MTITQVRRQATPDAAQVAQVALDRAAGHLLGLQDAAGWGKGELETNVTMEAGALLLRGVPRSRTAERQGAAPRGIRSQRRADGTWANWHGGRADPSTTIEAYVALRLAGD